MYKLLLQQQLKNLNKKLLSSSKILKITNGQLIEEVERHG